MAIGDRSPEGLEQRDLELQCPSRDALIPQSCEFLGRLEACFPPGMGGLLIPADLEVTGQGQPSQ